MLDHFLHAFAGLQDGTQTTKNSRADEPDAYSALKVRPTGTLPCGTSSPQLDETRNIGSYWIDHQSALFAPINL